MRIVKFDPVREFENIQNNFERFFGDIDLAPFKHFNPSVDVIREKDKIVIEAEMPGVKKDEIKISIKDNVLTIEGEKKFSEEKKEKEYYRSERSYGAFKRSFTLPEDVDVENVKAKFEDGILSLSMNKIEPKQPEVKEIKVN